MNIINDKEVMKEIEVKINYYYYFFFLKRDAQQVVNLPDLRSTCKLDQQNLLLVYSNAIYKFNVITKQRAATPFITGYTSLSSCTVDKSGSIYISEAGIIDYY